MAYGLKTHQDTISATNPEQWVKQQYMTASECDKLFGTHFVEQGLPTHKNHPLYRLLKARKEDKMTH